jgi:hypothetical protein
MLTGARPTMKMMSLKVRRYRSGSY